jgi:hypothetical protein
MSVKPNGSGGPIILLGRPASAFVVELIGDIFSFLHFVSSDGESQVVYSVIQS